MSTRWGGAERREHQAIREGLQQLRDGWKPEQIVAVLADAHKVIADLRAHEQVCNWCDNPVTEPVRDPVAVSWIGAFATTWCSQECRDAETEHRINAAGGQP